MLIVLPTRRDRETIARGEKRVGMVMRP